MRRDAAASSKNKSKKAGAMMRRPFSDPYIIQRASTRFFQRLKNTMKHTRCARKVTVQVTG